MCIVCKEKCDCVIISLKMLMLICVYLCACVCVWTGSACLLCWRTLSIALCTHTQPQALIHVNAPTLYKTCNQFTFNYSQLPHWPQTALHLSLNKFVFNTLLSRTEGYQSRPQPPQPPLTLLGARFVGANRAFRYRFCSTQCLRCAVLCLLCYLPSFLAIIPLFWTLAFAVCIALKKSASM